ncbi:uncharacterized protein YneF (UPF0154 family) [Hymenobacter luteus]|uniref:Uncharacterized protein YneF (UPF0154 family) n=2 Tax=Hymenobacter TaxID=89966 RepID=A0A7W9SWY1_9BACT|nr:MULTISPECIES: hypothetical protein [Hymenobacter]MBB4600299.1 uncharacterized protein YneF (UPF0154 family) [Hymenobacter latericoloratus]MBB6057391.1 uncharacterized protein YneF (UPF0154 family) [Hymenobacter luteus]
MKSKILSSRNVLILLTTIIIILISELYKSNYPKGGWVPAINLFNNISVAVLTGLLVGLYFDLVSRKEVYDDMLNNFNISKEVIRAGLINYFPSFSDFDFRGTLAKSNQIDMYLTYGQTLFNSHNDTLMNLARQKGKNINIYLAHEDNIFIPPLEQHWGNQNSQVSIKSKIVETKNMLTGAFNDLKSKKLLKAKIRIVFVKRHPVFYSFYRFDNELLLVPSKISHIKSIKPFAFLFRKTDDNNSVYNKCMEELSSVTSDPNFFEEYVFKP